MAGNNVPPINHEQRLTRVEADLQSLTTNVNHLTGTVEKAIEGIGKIEVALTNAQAPRKVEWQTVLGVAGFILMLFGIGVTPLYWRSDKTERLLEKTTEELIQHRQMAIHPVAAQMMADLKELTAVKEAYTAKETALLREVYDAKLTTAVTAQQRVDEAQAALIMRLREEFDEVKSLGSPLTRERLATLEAEMKRLQGAPK